MDRRKFIGSAAVAASLTAISGILAKAGFVKPQGSPVGVVPAKVPVEVVTGNPKLWGLQFGEHSLQDGTARTIYGGVDVFNDRRARTVVMVLYLMHRDEPGRRTKETRAFGIEVPEEDWVRFIADATPNLFRRYTSKVIEIDHARLQHLAEEAHGGDEASG